MANMVESILTGETSDESQRPLASRSSRSFTDPSLSQDSSSMNSNLDKRWKSTDKILRKFENMWDGPDSLCFAGANSVADNALESTTFSPQHSIDVSSSSPTSSSDEGQNHSSECKTPKAGPNSGTTTPGTIERICTPMSISSCRGSYQECDKEVSTSSKVQAEGGKETTTPEFVTTTSVPESREPEDKDDSQTSSEENSAGHEIQEDASPPDLVTDSSGSESSKSQHDEKASSTEIPVDKKLKSEDDKVATADDSKKRSGSILGSNGSDKSYMTPTATSVDQSETIVTEDDNASNDFTLAELQGWMAAAVQEAEQSWNNKTDQAGHDLEAARRSVVAIFKKHLVCESDETLVSIDNYDSRDSMCSNSITSGTVNDTEDEKELDTFRNKFTVMQLQTWVAAAVQEVEENWKSKAAPEIQTAIDEAVVIFKKHLSCTCQKDQDQNTDEDDLFVTPTNSIATDADDSEEMDKVGITKSARSEHEAKPSTNDPDESVKSQDKNNARTLSENGIDEKDEGTDDVVSPLDNKKDVEPQGFQAAELQAWMMASILEVEEASPELKSVREEALHIFKKHLLCTSNSNVMSEDNDEEDLLLNPPSMLYDGEKDKKTLGRKKELATSEKAIKETTPDESRSCEDVKTQETVNLRDCDVEDERLANAQVALPGVTDGGYKGETALSDHDCKDSLLPKCQDDASSHNEPINGDLVRHESAAKGELIPLGNEERETASSGCSVAELQAWMTALVQELEGKWKNKATSELRAAREEALTMFNKHILCSAGPNVTISEDNDDDDLSLNPRNRFDGKKEDKASVDAKEIPSSEDKGETSNGEKSAKNCESHSTVNLRNTPLASENSGTAAEEGALPFGEQNNDVGISNTSKETVQAVPSPEEKGLTPNEYRTSANTEKQDMRLKSTAPASENSDIKGGEQASGAAGVEAENGKTTPKIHSNGHTPSDMCNSNDVSEIAGRGSLGDNTTQVPVRQDATKHEVLRLSNIHMDYASNGLTVKQIGARMTAAIQEVQSEWHNKATPELEAAADEAVAIFKKHFSCISERNSENIVFFYSACGKKERSSKNENEKASDTTAHEGQVITARNVDDTKGLTIFGIEDLHAWMSAAVLEIENHSKNKEAPDLHGVMTKAVGIFMKHFLCNPDYDSHSNVTNDVLRNRDDKVATGKEEDSASESNGKRSFSDGNDKGIFTYLEVQARVTAAVEEAELEWCTKAKRQLEAEREAEMTKIRKEAELQLVEHGSQWQAEREEELQELKEEMEERLEKEREKGERLREEAVTLKSEEVARERQDLLEKIDTIEIKVENEMKEYENKLKLMLGEHTAEFKSRQDEIAKLKEDHDNNIEKQRLHMEQKLKDAVARVESKCLRDNETQQGKLRETLAKHQLELEKHKRLAEQVGEQANTLEQELELKTQEIMRVRDKEEQLRKDFAELIAKQENESLQYEEKVKKLRDEHRSEIDQIIAEAEAKCLRDHETQQSKLRDTLEKKQLELEKQKRSAEQIGEQATSLEQELELKKKELERACEKEEKFRQECDELKSKQENESMQYEEKLKKLRDEHRLEIDEMLAQLDLVEGQQKERWQEREKSAGQKDVIIVALSTQLADAASKLSSIERDCEKQKAAANAAREEATIAHQATKALESKNQRMAEEHKAAVKVEKEKRHAACERVKKEMIAAAEVQFGRANKTYQKLKKEHQANKSIAAMAASEIEASHKEMEALRKSQAAKDIETSAEIAQLKALLATTKANLARKTQEHRKELEASLVAEAETRANLAEASTNCSTAHRSLATVVAEKEKLAKEVEEMKSMCEELMLMVERNGQQK